MFIDEIVEFWEEHREDEGRFRREMYNIKLLLNLFYITTFLFLLYQMIYIFM